MTGLDLFSYPTMICRGDSVSRPKDYRIILGATYRIARTKQHDQKERTKMHERYIKHMAFAVNDARGSLRQYQEFLGRRARCRGS